MGLFVRTSRVDFPGCCWVKNSGHEAVQNTVLCRRSIPVQWRLSTRSLGLAEASHIRQDHQSERLPIGAICESCKHWQTISATFVHTGSLCITDIGSAGNTRRPTAFAALQSSATTHGQFLHQCVPEDRKAGGYWQEPSQQNILPESNVLPYSKRIGLALRSLKSARPFQAWLQPCQRPAGRIDIVAGSCVPCSVLRS